MSGARDHLDHLDERGARLASPRAAVPETGPAIAGPADPRLSHAGAPASSLLHLQRTAGNAAVSSIVAPAVQRKVEIDEMSSDITSVPDAGDGATEAPAGGGPVTSDGGGTTISGPTITLDAAMTRANGVLHADVIQADTVIAANYTPGAGNLY